MDASYEVDTLNEHHEVHLFVGGRRVATSQRTGLGNASKSGAIESVTSYHPDQVGTNVLVVKTQSTGQTLSRSVLEPFGTKSGGHRAVLRGISSPTRSATPRRVSTTSAPEPTTR